MCRPLATCPQSHQMRASLERSKSSTSTELSSPTGFIIRQKEPTTLEMPFDQVEPYLTPTNLFYVPSHFPAPSAPGEDKRCGPVSSFGLPCASRLESERHCVPLTRHPPRSISCPKALGDAGERRSPPQQVRRTETRWSGLIFAVNTTVAALIALLVAFTFNLDQPQW